MLIGYARVSKADGSQLLDLQRDALIDAGAAEERIYEDLASGRKDHRPGLEAGLKALQPGNTFVVWKLDRLGRDLKHLVSTVEALRERGVGLRVLAGAGAEIDTGTANGRLIFAIFAALAEFERELIAERTRAGLAAAQDGPRHAADGDERHGGARDERTGSRPAAGDHNDDAVHVRQRRRHGEGARAEAARRAGAMSRGGTPAEGPLHLPRRLDELSPRHRGRRLLVEGTAELFGASLATVYRVLAGQLRPGGLRRADRGEPRKIPRAELERYCELVAALKLRTPDLKGRRLSTARCISLLEEYGVKTPDGLPRRTPLDAPVLATGRGLSAGVVA